LVIGNGIKDHIAPGRSKGKRFGNRIKAAFTRDMGQRVIQNGKA
jgi:hypothetical protein